MEDIKYNHSENSIILCCGRGRCPELSFTQDGLVKIIDDFGGEIKIEQDQALLISKAIKKLNNG